MQECNLNSNAFETKLMHLIEFICESRMSVKTQAIYPDYPKVIIAAYDKYVINI